MNKITVVRLITLFVLSFALSVFFVSPILASNKPIYLNCDASSEKVTYKFSLKLDEDSGKITHTEKGNIAYNVEGFFSVDAISYKVIDEITDLRLSYYNEINRANLKLKSTLTVEMTDPKLAIQIPRTTEVTNGSCHIVKAKNHKI